MHPFPAPRREGVQVGTRARRHVGRSRGRRTADPGRFGFGDPGRARRRGSRVARRRPCGGSPRQRRAGPRPRRLVSTFFRLLSLLPEWAPTARRACRSHVHARVEADCRFVGSFTTVIVTRRSRQQPAALTPLIGTLRLGDRCKRSESIGRSNNRTRRQRSRVGPFQRRALAFGGAGGHSSRNAIAAMTVGRSAPASNPIGRIAPSKKRPSSAWPAGFGAFAITVSPPPATAP